MESKPRGIFGKFLMESEPRGIFEKFLMESEPRGIFGKINSLWRVSPEGFLDILCLWKIPDV